jgi:hypothetical protein
VNESNPSSLGHSPVPTMLVSSLLHPRLPTLTQRGLWATGLALPLGHWAEGPPVHISGKGRLYL